MRREIAIQVCDNCGSDEGVVSAVVNVDGLGRRSGHLCERCGSRLLRSVKYLPPGRPRRTGGLASLPILTGSKERPQNGPETARQGPNDTNQGSSPTPARKGAQRAET